MKLPVAINKLSTQLGLTSRTLRHWESEGLFTSIRDQESGWRLYDEEAIVCIKIVALLRKLDIPLKDVKIIMDHKNLKTVESVIQKQLLFIDVNNTELMARKNLLNNFLNSIMNLNEYQAGNSLEELNHIFYAVLKHDQSEKEEEIIMINNEVNNIEIPSNNQAANNIEVANTTNNNENNVRFITLPSMRVVYNTAIGFSPEEEATEPVIEWLEISKLMGTTRLFGGNVKPFPSKTSPEYGYGMCASIPEGIEVPAHLKEMRIPGGLYAIMPSSDNIYESWQLLMKCLKDHSEYIPDHSRLCFEEHIRNGNPNGQGSQFILNLLEPVKRK
jgi:DNA-binding transcriptional MerR regulator/DNA gyrase inhibitor GyrI